MDTQDPRSIERALNSAANQVLAVVAPATSRLVQAAVTVAEADTASTDGVHIPGPLGRRPGRAGSRRRSRAAM